MCSIQHHQAGEASGILEAILQEYQVHLGGSSIGKGFSTAAKAKLEQEDQEEDAFYVVDIGVLASQMYQWRRYFPRVEAFYAVKCNPDLVVLKTLMVLGCKFDCASQREIELIRDVSKQLHLPTPEIIYANPCKPPSHLKFAVKHDVRMVTFDNVAEVHKCAAISKTDIQLVLRIVTDDRGSQCRLSSKFGAPKSRWRSLLHAAYHHGMQVVGVSFHVGSGCRDASRYEAALKDARELFDMAQREYGFVMTILDIGGGFPGETHSFWNPQVLDEQEEEQPLQEEEEVEGMIQDMKNNNNEEHGQPYMFFMEIAEAVAPMIDALFPPHIRVIAEPGRYFVAAAATLVASVVGARSNEVEASSPPQPVSDAATTQHVYEMTRKEENKLVRTRGTSIDLQTNDDQHVWENITEEINDYARYYAKQNLVTVETDAYNDGLDLYKEDFDTASDLLGVPDAQQIKRKISTVEGMTKSLAMGENDNMENTGVISLAAAGEAAVNGMVMQAVQDSSPMQDDFAYYVNDGVYGAFNNLMFDHATVRPRVLKTTTNAVGDRLLYASTVFGPTCDSIDVIARSVLLPKLKIGDWLYFQNMGAYTMAAASSFNGFMPTQNFYVCSVQPEYFASLIAGPAASAGIKPDGEEEKKDVR